MTHFNRLLLIFITFVCLSAQNKSLDEIIAVIGDEIITKSDIEQFLLQLKVQNKMNDEQLSSQRPLIMKQMVDEKLLIIKAALDSVEVPEEQLVQESDKRWNDIIQRVQQYGGEKYLEQIYNDKIKNIKKRHRKQIEKELTIYKFRSQYLQNIKISRGEVEEFFKTYKDSLPTQAERVEISNLLLKVHASPERLAESYKKAELVLERLKKGESFKDLAKEFSDDPSKEAGGYLGKVERGTFVKEYEDAAYNLKPNEYTLKPVLSPYGYHIIMLHSKTNEECETSHILFLARPDENDTKTATQKMDSIRTAILENKLSFEKAVELYSTDLESKANNGYLGIFPLEQMPDENTKTIIGKLADNDYSEPFVQGGDAIQLIKLIKRYPASKYDMNADYSSVESLALRFKQNQEFQKLMTELQTTIPIELY